MIEVSFDSATGIRGLVNFLLRMVPATFRKLEKIGADLIDEVAEDLRKIILDKDRSKFVKRLRAISPEWRREKKRRGWKLHQLAGSGAYGRSIVTEHDFDNHEHKIGVKAAMYPGHKFSYADLAAYLENGTKWFKPIPHWRKAAKYFETELVKRSGKELHDVVIRIG